MNRVRTYYLNTMLPESSLEQVRTILAEAGLLEHYVPRGREGEVAIFSKDGNPFRRFKDAEIAQRFLTHLPSDTLKATAIAFFEIEFPTPSEAERNYRSRESSSMIVKQDEREVVGKHVLVACLPDACLQVEATLTDMGIDAQVAANAHDALLMLEEGHPDLLVMDLHLPDMHGWEMLSKVREMQRLDGMHVIALSDSHEDDGDLTLALTVARVDALLEKPIASNRLRRTIYMALKASDSTSDSTSKA